MTKLPGPYHYEFIPGRTPGHEWRVGDQDDDMVADFPTEEQAKTYVQVHNEAIKSLHPNWKQ